MIILQTKHAILLEFIELLNESCTDGLRLEFRTEKTAGPRAGLQTNCKSYKPQL